MADTLVEAKELVAKYSIEDVAKHNTSEDCWIIIKGRVYDVTNFLDDHPGGPSVLADAAGTDATEQFERAGHPANVQKTMDKYHIGIIEAATTNSDSSATTATSDLLAEKEIKKEFDAKKGGWDRFRDWTDRNPFVWYVVASGIVLMAAWIAAGFGVEAGYGGRFEIVGFIPNVTDYAYKLKNPSTWQLIAPWVGYAPHQVLHFYFVYRAQAAAPAYSDEWRWFNWDMFKLNFFFVAVKFTFSHFFYNGLSAVLPLWFGVGTVAVMLMVVIVIRLPVRGLFFGQGRTKFLHPKLLMKELADFVKKYHGYYISFAIINDFWYHPFEATPGHMLGLFNDLLLLWQSSALYHRSHRNKYWTLLLETIVLLHSGIIAIPRDTFLAETAGRVKGTASMFAFGYALIFVVTQMWDLGNNVAARWVIRALCLAGFAAAFVLYYVLSNFTRDMWEIIRIPLIEYGIVIFFIFAFAGLARIVWRGTKKDSTGRIFLTSFFAVICLAVPFVILSFILSGI